MNFNTPVQNFGGPVQDFSTPPQSFDASVAIKAGVYSENCWIVTPGKDGPTFGSRYGNQPRSTPRPDPGYKSPNDGLVFSSVPDISFGPTGHPIDPWTGEPVDRDFAAFMRATYPDRSWAQICQHGDMPRPGYRTNAQQRADAAKNSGKSTKQGLQKPTPPAARRPTKGEKALKDTFEPAEIEHSAHLDRAATQTKKFIFASKSYLFAEGECATQRTEMARKCMESLGITKEGATIEATVKAAALAVARGSSKGAAIRTMATESTVRAAAAAMGSQPCNDLLKEITYNSCVKKAMADNALFN